jgi:2-dehydropantoate 2-reductase
MIADECLKVAERDGIKFDIDFVKMVNKMIKDSKNISSMQQDILKGKKTEIDYLNGAVVELGRKYKIKCPVNEGLVMIIKRMEK